MSVFLYVHFRRSVRSSICLSLPLNSWTDGFDFIVIGGLLSGQSFGETIGQYWTALMSAGINTCLDAHSA